MTRLPRAARGGLSGNAAPKAARIPPETADGFAAHPSSGAGREVA